MTEVAKELDKILGDFEDFLHNHGPDDKAKLDAKTAISKLLEKQDIKSRIDELKLLDKHGLTVMGNDGEVNYIQERIERLSNEN